MQKINKKKESKSLFDFSLERIFGESREIFSSNLRHFVPQSYSYRESKLLWTALPRKFPKKGIRSRRTCTGT